MSGAGDSAQSLTDGIDGLVALGTHWLASDDKGLRGRLAPGGLTRTRLATIAKVAQTLRATNDAALLRPAQARVTQPQLDLADGVNILLMGHIVRGFNQGHEADSTIPKLQPQATRHLFARKPKRVAKKKVDTKPAPPSPSPAPAPGKLEATPESAAAPAAPAETPEGDMAPSHERAA